jgi:hypothetical protein
MQVFNTPRDLSLYVWERELGEPYLWAGSNPLAGFDCSGLVIEGLKAAGRLPRDGDWNAATLAQKFPLVTTFQPGNLVFYNRGTPPAIGHVEIVYAVISGLVFTIAASGGGSGTIDRAAAIASDAYVKIRPIVPGWVRMVNPF